jgi:DNA sulfur modification protein DndD
MIIKRLTMHNFGVYASTNTFDFTGEKPIVLIGGLNGRGKTTFLEAVLLSLYGANSFAYKESTFKTYGQYLRSFVNVSDGTKKTFIELEFVLNNADRDHYIVRREWSAVNKVRTTEEIFVRKNGSYNRFLTDNWSMFVENILPSALSNFFFFDGEKIAELAVDSTNSQLKESIRAMLGISVLDTLHGDMQRNIRKLQKTSSASTETKEIDRLRTIKEEAESNLQKIEAEISSKEANLTTLKEQCEQEKLDYSAHGGDVIGQRDALLSQRAEVGAQSQQSRENLSLLASGSLPLNLVKDLLGNIAGQALKEKEASTKRQAVSYVNRLFTQFMAENKNASQVQSFMEYIDADSEKNSVETIYNLSDASLLQIQRLTGGGLEQTAENASAELERQAKLSKKSDEIENFLSIDINEEQLKKLYTNIRLMEQKITDTEADLAVLEQRRSNANGDLMKATSEFNKKVSVLLENLEADDDKKRDIKYSEMAVRVLDEFSVRLQKKKTGLLGETITSCYKKLANKKNLIDQITMDPVTLDLTYLNKDGLEVEKTALSAGEKQLMVISILWALAICSKKKLPVIIDTPLSRLDSNHRKSLIQTYFPQASEQTIILSTDSEIDQNYYQLMKENVGDEFTLSYDDKSKSTTILKGYFVGDKK